MLLRDRPLLVDGIDAAIYVEREIEGLLWDAVLSERNTLLLGAAGSGKTTLLRWLRARLRDEGKRCAFVSAALATDVSSFRELVAEALEEAFHDRPDRGVTGAFFKSGETVPRAVQLLYEVRRLATPEPVVILVDGLTDSGIAHDWFGRLRDELWELGHTWVLAARPFDSAAFRTPPADAFWSVVLELGPLTTQERDALLERGLEPEERAKVHAADLPPSLSPRELVATLHRVLSTPADAGVYLGEWLRRRQERAAALGAPEQVALAELEAIGRPVSAHDDDLLRRLEWSRPYAQRILARLQDAGLVRVIPERGGGQGRPRKLYEPAPFPTEEGT